MATTPAPGSSRSPDSLKTTASTENQVDFTCQQLEEIRNSLESYGRQIGMPPDVAQKSAKIFVDSFANRLEPDDE